MARYYGIIGYAEQIETSPGVWDDSVSERVYSGDVIRNSSRWSANQSSINDNLDISNQLSIVADPFAEMNFHKIKYAEFMGAKWKVINVEVQRPRLILTLGGEYNGE